VASAAAPGALFDPSTQQNFFKGSKVPELEVLALTETQLLEQTAALLGVSLAQLVRAGALVYAKREFLGHKKYLSPSPAAAEGDSSQVALLRSGSGVAGVADARIQAAFDALAEAKVPVTPAKLATRALTGYPTALRWLKIHHPELLVPKADAQEGPKTTSQAKTAQKPSETPSRETFHRPRRKSPPDGSVTPRTSLFRGRSP
jgi:hypothetical protein